jgi:hypothetical protein
MDSSVQKKRKAKEKNEKEQELIKEIPKLS